MKNAAEARPLRERWEAIFPHHCFAWLLAAVAWNMAVYYASRLVTTGMVHHSVALPIDGLIPLFPPAVVPYVLSYPFWLWNYYLIAREDRETCHRVLSAEILAKTVCLVFFLAFPTVMERPELTGTDIFTRILRIVYTDPPDNLLPSIHCLESWLCWRGLFGCRRVPRWYKTFSFFFALSVFASTVLVRQHCVIDCPTAIAAAELSLAVSALIGRKFKNKKERASRP